jgi:hypothetical protein
LQGGTLAIGDDTKVVLLAAGLIFIGALGLGAWKYRQIAASESSRAHPYVDVAHRAALLYSFATLLIATFVELSAWSELVNLLAAGALVFFFVTAVGGYAYHGAKRDTDNQFRDAQPGLHGYMWALMVTEIAAFAVLLAGFVKEQLL